MTGPKHEDSAARSIARNALHLLMGQVATTALSILLHALLARNLGAADYGLFFLVATMASFAAVFIEWGQGSLLVRDVARYPERTGVLLGSALAFRFAAAMAVLLPTALVTWALGYDGRTRGFAVAMILALLPMSLVGAFTCAFRGHQRMELDASVTALNRFLTLVVGAGVIALGGRLAAFMSVQAVAGAGALATAAVLFRRMRAGRLAVAGDAVKDLVVAGTALVAVNIGVSLQAWLDAVILSKLAPAATVGWYGAARNLMNLLVTPSAILAAACYPRLSRAVGDPGAFAREIRTTFRPFLWLGTLAAVGAFLFADVAVGIVYSMKTYGPAAIVTRAFGPVLILAYADAVWSNAIVAVGRTRALAVAKLVAVIVTASLDLALVPWFERHHGNGGLGLVVAGGCGEAVMIAIMLAVLPRAAVGRATVLETARALAVGAGTIALLGLVPRLPPVVAIPACIVVYTALSVALGLLKRSDLEALGRVVGIGRTQAAAGGGADPLGPPSV